MKMIESILGAGVFMLSAHNVAAQSATPVTAPDDATEITISYSTNGEKGATATSSSSGRNMLIERVIARRKDGVELEYDLQPEAKPEERARSWQLPARVIKGRDGRTRLVNRDQLETRLGNWLKAAQWDRSVCGRWIFTWNAFRIECDPDTVIAMIEGVDLAAQELRDGASYLDPRSTGPVRVTRSRDTAKGAQFTATPTIDPAKVSNERAETDVIMGELMRTPVSLETALLERTKEQVSGTIMVTWDVDTAGMTWKRTRTTVLTIRSADDRVEKETRIDTIERHSRRIVSSPAMPDAEA
ncbi:MAG: hypothetical protein ABW182_04640 [Sphingomonas sp.]